MSDDFEASTAARELLSSLVDGELDADTVAGVCMQWRESADARTTWHTYHLIGDALRSNDLVKDPARDANFLDAVRAGLAKEPVVLAPPPQTQAVAVAVGPAAPAAGAAGSKGRRREWIASAAVVACIVAVAGGSVLTWALRMQDDSHRVAAAARLAAPAPDPLLPSFAASEPSPARSLVAVGSGQSIHDAGLDRYLAAHKQFPGNSALGVPSAYLRTASIETPAR